MSQDQYAAGFFFSRSAAGKNHEKCLIATIAYQLLQSIPEARSFIEAATTKDPLIFMRSLNSQIRHLIVDPVKQMLAGPHNPSFPRLNVIDGLDECSPRESQTNILKAIHTAFKQDSFPFRILICSRAEPNICDMFESELADSTHRISLDNKYEPDIDIALYLRSKFSEIVRKRRGNHGIPLPHQWPSTKAIQILVSKASGQFIYAATVIRYVDVRHERPDDRLSIVLGLSGSQSSNPFTELDELYQEIFRAAVDKPLTSHLLGVLLLLKTPLPVASLENLLGLHPGDTERALCHLHSVVRIPNNVDGNNTGVGLYHASLGDFLFDSTRAGVYHIKMESVHATLAESCLRILSNQLIAKTTSIRRDTILMVLREDPAAEYAWHNWIHHLLNISSWNDKVIQEFRKLQPWVLLVWLNRRSIDEPLRDLRTTIDQFNKLQSWFIYQNTSHKPDGLILGTLCRNVLDLFFKNAWADILGDGPQNVALSLGILAVVLKPGSISSASLATLFKLDWVGFSRATFLIRPYINFGTSVDVACDAFSDFISHPEHSSEFNPNTPDIHADLVIRCVECISSHPPQDKQIWQLDPEGAYQYSIANWKDHLRQASPRRLLDYAYEVITRLGHRPTCKHEDPCDILCEADRTVRCIESTIIVATFYPYMTATSDIKLLKLLKEIIVVKYLDTALFSEVQSRFRAWASEYSFAMSRTQVQLGSSESSAIRRTISSSTESNSSTVDQKHQDVPSSRTQLEVHIGPSRARGIRGIGVSKFISSLTRNSSPVHQNHQYTLSSRTSQVYFGSSSPITGTGLTKFVSSLGASNPFTTHAVHGNYRYALSLWKDHLRHANSSPVLESFRTTTCICLSELVSVPAGQPSSKLTPDGRASLVIRVIECIAAHLPIDSDADQFARKQTLDFDSAGEYRDALFQWTNHLRFANPRRLLNYAYLAAYVINVRSGHQSCVHKDRCNIFCEVNKTIRCIESRIIDGEFFPQTLSVTDIKILKLLREIIDVKYLQNPLFTSINSRIQSWSADYRLTITRILVLKSEDPSTARKGVASIKSEPESRSDLKTVQTMTVGGCATRRHQALSSPAIQALDSP